METRLCEAKNCGKSFPLIRANRRFCSDACQRRSYRWSPKKVCVCKRCGNEFVPKKTDRKTFCGRDCSFANLRENTTGPSIRIRYINRCSCGVVFETNWPQARYCSPECLVKSSFAHEYDIEKTCLSCGEKFLFACTGGRPRKYCFECSPPHISGVEKTCPSCGEQFSGRVKYCSIKCYAEGQVRKRRKSGVEKTCLSCGEQFSGRVKYCSNKCGIWMRGQVRRARKRDAFIARVSRQEIVERDGGKCGICGKPVALDKLIPHPKAPTLDHIVPLSLGGTHEPRNVQLAHYVCNSKKGAAPGGQPLLISA
jgi:5-methylcytosine-specific restriction endonuclease McrA